MPTRAESAVCPMCGAPARLLKTEDGGAYQYVPPSVEMLAQKAMVAERAMDNAMFNPDVTLRLNLGAQYLEAKSAWLAAMQKQEAEDAHPAE